MRVRLGKVSRAEGAKNEFTKLIALALSEFGAPAFEHRFHTKRKWRFDFAWPQLRVALEIEGGTWTGGRHTRGLGYEGDCEKYNAAAELGWLVVRATTTMVKKGKAVADLAAVLENRRRKRDAFNRALEAVQDASGKKTEQALKEVVETMWL